MKRILLTATALSALTFGCGHTLMQPSADSAKTGVDATEATDQGDGDRKSSKGDQDEPGAVAEERQIGDFIVYRFSGSYRDRPIVLTQRVVGRENTTLVLDVTFDDGASAKHFRLEVHDEPGQANHIVSVARVIGDQEKPMEVEAYEQLMAKTVMPIEANEAVIDREVATVRIGSDAMACKKTTYRVLSQGGSATMTTFESPRFAWGDLGGEVLSSKGQLLYKAAVVEVGGAASATTGAVAASAELDDIDDWDDLED